MWVHSNEKDKIATQKPNMLKVEGFHLMRQHIHIRNPCLLNVEGTHVESRIC